MSVNVSLSYSLSPCFSFGRDRIVIADDNKGRATMPEDSKELYLYNKVWERFLLSRPLNSLPLN